MKKPMCCKFISLFAAIAIAVTSVFCVSAETPEATLSLGLKKWDALAKTYVNATTFNIAENSEKKLYVPITVKTDKNVGGLLLKVSYNSSLLSFSKNASFSLLSGDMDVNIYDSGTFVFLAMDTTEPVSKMNGEIYYLVFEAKEGTAEGSAGTFTLSVNSFFDTSKSQNDITFAAENATVSYTLTKSAVPEDLIKAAAKLKNITLDSQGDIKAAKLLYDALNPSRKLQFKNEYPDHYNWLSTAQTRYNRLAENETVAQLKKKAAEFVERNKNTLALDTEKMTLSDNEAVKSMKTDRKTLSDKEWQYVPSDKKAAYEKIVKRMQELLDEDEERRSIETEVNDYKEKYKDCLTESESGLKTNCEDYMVILDEAMLVFDTLSESAREQLKTFYEQLKTVQEKCLKYISENKESLNVRNNVLAFQNQWLQVLMLTSSTVKVNDELAINIMLQSYSKLGQKEQALLASKVESVRQLLPLIKNMSTNAAGGKNNVSNTGNTTLPNNNQNAAQNPSSDSSDTENDKTKTVSRLVYLAKENTFILIGMIILAAISFGAFGFTVFVIIKTRKRKTLALNQSEKGADIIEEKN